MDSISIDIFNARKIINSTPSSIDRFQRIYPFATENIPGCFSFYDFNDKDCLTVLGSSAQMLYMYLNGAKTVTTFDINKLTLYHFYFIKAFISSGLSKDKLAQLFLCDGENNTKVFNEISKHIDGDSYIFWKTLFEEYGPGLFNDFKLFNRDICSPSDIAKTSGYLNDENLIKLRSIVDKVEPNFINSNIKSLGNELNNKYDLMYLSNIIQYVKHKTLFGDSSVFTMDEKQIKEEKEESLRKYKSLLMNLSCHLKENGTLIGGYIYVFDDNTSNNPIFDKPSRDSVFNSEDYNYHLFDSFALFQRNADEYPGAKDACLIYSR